MTDSFSPELNEEMSSFERDLNDLRPRKLIDFDAILENRKTGSRNSDLYLLLVCVLSSEFIAVKWFAIMGTDLSPVQFNSIHVQTLRVLQIIELRVGGCLSSVQTMQFRHFLLEVWRLVWNQFYLRNVTRFVFFGAKVSQFR